MNLAGMAKLRMLRRYATSLGLETFYIMGGFGFTIILILVIVSSRSVNCFISLVITSFSFLIQTQSLRFFHFIVPAGFEPGQLYCPGWFWARTSLLSRLVLSQDNFIVPAGFEPGQLYCPGWFWARTTLLSRLVLIQENFIAPAGFDPGQLYCPSWTFIVQTKF